MKYKTLIDKFIEEHTEELIEDVMKLIRVESIKMSPQLGKPFGENNFKVLNIATKILEKHNFDVKNYDNYVITASLNDKSTNLDILAHLDVVPAEDENWSVTSPYCPLVKDNKLYGRGSLDDKGPAIAALYAMKTIKELDIPLSKNVKLILGTDEESGSDDIAYYYSKEKYAPMTISPDAQFPLINIEKGILHGEFEKKNINQYKTINYNGKIISFNCGDRINVIPNIATTIISDTDKNKLISICKDVSDLTNIKYEIVSSEFDKNITIIARGNSCHASTPELGNNALTGLLELLSNKFFENYEGYNELKIIHDFFPHNVTDGQQLGVNMKDDLSGSVSICLTKLKYENNQIYGGFDSRTPLCATNENFRDVIRDKFLEYKLVLGNRDIYPPHHVPHDSEFVQTLLDCYELYSGKREEPITTGGGTYVHAVPNGVAFGCANKDIDYHMHGSDEFIDIDQLIMSAKIYAQAIIRLCN